MIEINLLPAELRIVEKKAKAPPIPKVRIAIGAGVCFVLLTLFFYFDYLGASKKLKSLDAKWMVLSPQSKVLNDLKDEVENVLQKEREFLAAFVATDRPLTFIMEWLSEELPERAWLTHVSLEHAAKEEKLVVQGLCVSSKTQTSIEAIEMYLHELKKKMPTAGLSLTTSRRFEEGIEATSFTAVFKWILEVEKV